MATMTSERADAEALRQSVERIVADRCGRRAVIAGIDRRRHDYSASYASDIVTVQLATGEELKLFLKSFGFSLLPKDEPEQQRDRELQVYRDLLVEANLGTARYYGSVWEAGTGGRGEGE